MYVILNSVQHCFKQQKNYEIIVHGFSVTKHIFLSKAFVINKKHSTHGLVGSTTNFKNC